MPNNDSLGAGRAALQPQASPAAESSRIFRPVETNLYAINCYSTTAGLLLLIDDTVAPTSGAAVMPKKVFSVPANGMFSYDWRYPIRFAKGCIAVFSTSLNPFVYTASNTAFISGEFA